MVTAVIVLVTAGLILVLVLFEADRVADGRVPAEVDCWELLAKGCCVSVDVMVIGTVDLAVVT